MKGGVNSLHKARSRYNHFTIIILKYKVKVDIRTSFNRSLSTNSNSSYWPRRNLKITGSLKAKGCKIKNAITKKFPYYYKSLTSEDFVNKIFILVTLLEINPALQQILK